MKMEVFKILSIDAWRDMDGWTWNNHFKVGEITREDLEREGRTNRTLLAYLRREGYLSDRSKGRVRVCDEHSYDGTFIEIQDRHTGEPLFAISSIH